jgi:hypothetical protein
MEILMMMNALLISTAAYAVSTFLCVASVRAEVEEAAAFPPLPLPPKIVELIGLTDAKGHDVSVSMVPLEPEPQALMPDVGGVRAQDLVARVPTADEPLSVAAPFPFLPLPPEVGDLIGLRQTYPKGRNAHLALIRREAERYRVPPELADAVAQVESAYNPQARASTAPLPPRRPGSEKMRIASAGQVRLAAAQNAQLGQRASERVAQPVGSSAAKPLTPARNGRQFAAAAERASARVAQPVGSSAAKPVTAAGAPLPPRRPEPERTRVASAGQVALTSAQKKQTDLRAAR